MEPCDLDFYLEKIVFPKKFKYKILKKRKIDSQNFECDMRIALNDYDDVREWFKHFKGNTNTEWVLRNSTVCEETVLNQLYVCKNSSYGKKRKYDDDEGSKSDFNCKAAISVKIKKGGKRTYYQDEYVKRGYKGVMRICFIHTHLVDKAEVLNMARQSEETKRAFLGYFTEGMSPSEAIKNHEEILLLEGHEDLGDSRKNPPEHWVYSLYEEWTKQIESRLQLESQLTRASVFWRLQNRPNPPENSSKSKNIVKLCKVAEDINGMQVPVDLDVSDVDDEEDDSDSENQYDSYDEDSSPQVSASFVSVSTTAHQSTASSAPLKLNVPNSINIARGCTLQVIKNNVGNHNKSSTSIPPLFVRIGNNSNISQGNSLQIITTSHDNNSKKSVFKLLTVTANSRKCADIAPGKTFQIINNSKAKAGSAKAVFIVDNSNELKKSIAESSPKSDNITKVSNVKFVKNSDESNVTTPSNVKPVFVRIIKKDNKGASTSVKSNEVQKEAQTVLQNILTRFQNSDDKDISNNKGNKMFPKNKAACHRSDSPGGVPKPVLKKSVQNFAPSPCSENLLVSDVSKRLESRTSESDRNCPKLVSENTNNSIIQPSRDEQNLAPDSQDSVLFHFGKKDKVDLRNGDQRKEQKSSHFADFGNHQQQSESIEKFNSTDRTTPASISYDKHQGSNLAVKNYCDISQASPSPSLESVSHIFNQTGSVQSIRNPISSVQGLNISGSGFFESINPIQKLLKHDTVVTSSATSSTLSHENLFGEVYRENNFSDSKSLEGLPIQGCPFPLPEDFYSTLAGRNMPYLGNQNGGESRTFHMELSKDPYISVENSGLQVLESETDCQRRSLLLSETCNSSGPANVTSDSGNHSIDADISFTLPDLHDFSDSSNDMNSSPLPVDLDMSNEDSFHQIFPDLSKLEDELNSFGFKFPTVPSSQPVDVCSSHVPDTNQLSLMNRFTNFAPELQICPGSLFQNCEDNILPLPANLKGNMEDVDILKKILNIKNNKLEGNELENLFQQPESITQKEILEKWDSEMRRLRGLLEENINDTKLMQEANQFLERIKESVVTPSELADLFSSACNLKSQQK